MKKICILCVLVIAVSLMATTSTFAMFAMLDGGGGGGNPTPQASGITSSSSTIHVHTEFDAYGVAIKSTTTTTTITTTSDGKGGTSTTTEVTVVESTWHGGSLKIDTVSTNIGTTSTDGSYSHTSYTDTYTYSAEGKLQGVSGGGTFSSYDGETKQTQTGVITRSFIVKDGQALLTSSSTSGHIYDKDGGHIGTFSSTTTIAESDYSYLGGSWVPMKVTQTSRTNWDNGSYDTITRVTTYSRNEQGVIRGISQTATGERVVVTGESGPGQVSKITYTLTNYSVTVAFDAKQGWYIASEDYDWVETSVETNPVPQGVDPVVYGTIIGSVNINGVTYLQVAAEYVDILDGQGLQEADGEIFLISCDEKELAALEDLIDRKVLLMGDIVGGTEGAAAILDLNPEYGGGMKIDVPQDISGEQGAKILGALYQGESWYQGQLGVMAEVWSGLRVDWATGINLLVELAIR